MIPLQGVFDICIEYQWHYEVLVIMDGPWVHNHILGREKISSIPIPFFLGLSAIENSSSYHIIPILVINFIQWCCGHHNYISCAPKYWVQRCNQGHGTKAMMFFPYMMLLGLNHHRKHLKNIKHSYLGKFSTMIGLHRDVIMFSATLMDLCILTMVR